MKKSIVYLCLLSLLFPWFFAQAKGSWKELPPKKKNGIVSKRKGHESNIAVSSTGKIYAAYQDNGKRVQVKSYVNGKWVSLEDASHQNGILSTGRSGNPNMATKGNELYVAYMDEGANNKARVLKWNGSSWSAVADAQHPNGYISTGKGHEPELAFDKTGEYLYAIFTDIALGSRTRVLRWKAATGWENVGANNGLVNNSASQEGTIVSSKVDNSMYIAFEDHTYGNRVRVMKWNNTSWANVADSTYSSGLLSQYDAYSPSIDVDSHDNLYLVYTSKNKPHGNVALGSLKRKEANTYIYKWNGSSWAPLGGGRVSNAKHIESTVAVDNRGYVYVAFSEHKKNYRIERKKKTFWRVRVKVWTGSSWKNAKKGGSEYLNKGKGKADPSLATLNNKLYVSYTDDFYKNRVRALELTY